MGTLSTKSCYDVIDKDPHISKNFTWKWELHCPNKIKYFLWLSYYNRLPCRYHLARIGMNINDMCTICRNETEEIIHIFWGCTVAKNLWQQVGIDIKSHHPNKDNWLIYLRELNPNIDNNHISWSNLFPFIIWNIWLNRNNNNINNTSNEISLKFVLNQATDIIY